MSPNARPSLWSLILLVLAVTLPEGARAWKDNWSLTGTERRLYKLQVDKKVAVTGTSMRLTSKVAADDKWGTAYYYTDVHQRRGQRLRIQASLRQEGVVGHVRLAAATYLFSRRPRSLAKAGPDRIRSSAEISGPVGDDWQTVSVVIDVPDDAWSVQVAVSQQGPGTTWIDNVRFLTVGEDVPLTGPTIFPEPVQFDFSLPDDAGPGAWPAGWWLEADKQAQAGVVLHEDQEGVALRLISPEEPSGQPSRVSQTLQLRRFDEEVLLLAARLRVPELEGAARLFVEFSEGQRCPYGGCRDGWRQVSEALRAPVPWRDLAMTARVPAEARYLRLGVELEGAGEIWVDDFVLDEGARSAIAP